MTTRRRFQGRPARSRVPDRGDVIWINLDPQAGHEQAGHRPCLVLSPANYNGAAGRAVMCPITNEAKGYPFEVRLPPSAKTTGVVLADHIKRLDWRSRGAQVKEKLPDSLVREVLDTTLALLDPATENEQHVGDVTT